MTEVKEDMGHLWVHGPDAKLSAVQREALKKLPLRIWVNARQMGFRTVTLVRLHTAGLVRMRNRKAIPGEPWIRRPKPVVDLEFFKADA